MAKRKILALLAIAVVCCALMVSCPPNGEMPTPGSDKGTVTVQNGVAKLETKSIWTYGVGKTKATAVICGQAQGNTIEYISLASNVGLLNGAEGDDVKFFVTNVQDYVLNGFNKATELASYTLDKSKTEIALPTPTASSVEVSGNKTALTIKKTSAEASSKLIYVLSTSSVDPSYAFFDLPAIYEGKELTTGGITLNNVDKYLYIFRVSPKGLVYSDGYAVTIPNN